MRIHKTRSGGIRFASIPSGGVQNISVNTLNDLANHVSVSDEEISFNTEDGTVTFDVVYPPGRYCLTCNERLPDAGSTAEHEAENAKACREHCESHGKKMVTDRKWPHGYRHQPKAYTCKAKDSELTKKLKAAKRG